MFGDLNFVKLISLVYAFNSCYDFNFKFILASLYYFSLSSLILSELFFLKSIHFHSSF